MTTEEREAMESLSDARLRRNYQLVEAQKAMAYEQYERGQRNDRGMAHLNEWSALYLDEIVRRGIRA